jgi:hypothetical protein
MLCWWCGAGEARWDAKRHALRGPRGALAVRYVYNTFKSQTKVFYTRLTAAVLGR